MFDEKSFSSLLNSSITKAFCLCVLSLYITVSSFYAQSSEAIILELDKPIVREISGGQKHLYRIKLPAKQFVKIHLEQRGIDTVGNLLDKNGKIVTRYDLDPRNKGKEEIILTSNAEGDYQVSVAPRQKSSSSGHYQIGLTESRPATEKEIAIDETRRSYTKAVSLWRGGKYDDALRVAESMLAIWRKYPDEEHPEAFRVFMILGSIYKNKSDFKKAESYYLKSITMNEKSFGKNHISKSLILNNLGTLYLDRGNYPKSDEYFKQTLEIRERELDPNHLLIAGILNNIGNLNNSKGDNEKAELFYRRSLKIYESAQGPESQRVAQMLNNIANLYSDPAKIEPLMTRSLSILEKVLGPEHPRVGQSLFNLAIMYRKKKEYKKAKELCQRSLSIFEKKLGAEHPFTSYALSFLAYTHEISEEFGTAVALYHRIIAVRQKTQGKHHPALGSAYQSLASVYVKTGDIEKAVNSQAKANEIFEYNVSLNLSVGSERDKLNYIKTVSKFENITLALDFQIDSKSQAATNIGATTVLQRKGRVLDAMSDSLGILRRRFNETDRELLKDFNEITKRLVGFVLAGPKGLKAEQFQQTIRELENRRENLENQISKRSGGFYGRLKAITLGAVRETLPKNSALLEFSIYSPIVTSNGGNKEIARQPRYIVYVVTSANKVRGRDLGVAKEINDAIVAYRKALGDPKRKDVKELSRAVDEKVLRPVRDLLEGETHLLVSPDGQLSLIPFEALVDDKGKYAIERFSISYLSSGRDLLRMQIPRESKTKPLLVANPLFGSPGGEAGFSVREAVESKKSITATRDLSGTYFAPLSGTRREADSIKRLFPEATILGEKGATETALKKIVSPSILHIATHGFFLEDVKDEIKNPLLRSGLAFAGANQRKSGEDDGILTALEASGLNLWGTKLVVLSACDTGLGEVRNGEGVYGLRRAFVLAGTESLVMSLWAVSDYVTRELMVGYYTNLKRGMGRGEALRRVQLTMLKKKNRQHPFFWASFIQSGEWANLDGKR